MVLYIGIIRTMHARLLALDIRLLSFEAHIAQNMLLMKWHTSSYRDHLNQLAGIVKSMDRIRQEYADSQFDDRNLKRKTQ